MGEHILVPIDQSPQSRRALKYAAEEYPNAEIIALHIIDPSNYQCGNSHIYYTEELLKRLDDVEKSLFEPARQTATEHGRKLTTKLKAGPPVDAIIEYVTTHEIDHIVVGSHGRTGISRMLLGSIAEAIARRSPVPVTIIPSECSRKAEIQRS